jgi:ABC-type multidrug transport system ATPase subunit
MSLIIETQQLTKRYGSLLAVDALTLNVEKGEVFGFLGPNGAGKTTTIGMLLGLLQPSAGSVRLCGQPVTLRRSTILQRVGALVADPGFLPDLSGRENLRLLAYLHPGVTAQRIEEVLAQVGMQKDTRRKVKTYSTGMKQRLGLAMAMMHQPELLVLDEPTNGLDPAGMKEVRDLLRALPSQGVTVFLSSHLLHEIEQICDRVMVLNHGRVLAQGRVSDLVHGQHVVRVRVGDVPGTLEVLRAVPGVSKVAVDGSWVDVQGVPPEIVIESLVNKHLTPSEVTSGDLDLESVFLELTQDESSQEGK